MHHLSSIFTLNEYLDDHISIVNEFSIQRDLLLFWMDNPEIQSITFSSRYDGEEFSPYCIGITLNSSKSDFLHRINESLHIDFSDEDILDMSDSDFFDLIEQGLNEIIWDQLPSLDSDYLRDLYVDNLYTFHRPDDILNSFNTLVLKFNKSISTSALAVSSYLTSTFINDSLD